MPSPKAATLSAASQCPVCGKPVDLRYRPFCSKRCADVDLKRWLDGAYALSDGALRTVETGEDVEDRDAG